MMLVRPMDPLSPTRYWPGLRAWLALLMACVSGSALALTFGQVTVESGIGQPLRVAIEITRYKVEDLRRLKLQLAPPASFEQAQMVFHPALEGAQTRLEFRGDGKPFIALTGLTPVNDHFIDVIMEAQWPSGRLAMNYTLLVSPFGAPIRSVNTQSPLEVNTPVVSPIALAAAANPVFVSENQRTPERVTVRTGDTASQLLVRPLPEGVTLDQMLLAMVRANPEAFMEGNVNLLRVGAQVQLPNAQDAIQISAEEARQTVVTQTVDFVAYAQRLAQSAPQAPATASREMNGKLSALPPTPSPQLQAKDTLTLSKRDAVSSTSDEARLAVEREIQEKTEQLAALQRNLDTLKSLAVPPAPNTNKSSAAARVEPQPLSPSTPPAVAQFQPSSVFASISHSPSIWALALALLGGMLAWVWLVRRRPSNAGDLFGHHHRHAAPRAPIVPFIKEPHKEIQIEPAPWPSGLPPQFAHLDLNLTPTPKTPPSVDADQPAGPKA